MAESHKEVCMFELKYCPQCGTPLTEKYLENEGNIPYCEKCGDFRFPIFSTAVSMICMNEERDKVLLIRQYGRPSYILVAGYVTKGEDAEDTCQRELMEELSLTAEEIHFNRSHYFAPSNTLMLNFTVIVKESEPKPNSEIDEYHWFTVEEARKNIRPNSLAQKFLEGYFTKKYDF
jgi:NAD+ diphosphatase